jgi:hypothetical protein
LKLWWLTGEMIYIISEKIQKYLHKFQCELGLLVTLHDRLGLDRGVHTEEDQGEKERKDSKYS